MVAASFCGKDESVFDTLTKRYDTWYDSLEKGRFLYESELKCLMPMVDQSSQSILEIGVGTGRFAMHFSNAIGADPSFNALKMAKNRGIKTVQAYGETLPFRLLNAQIEFFNFFSGPGGSS